MTDYIYQSGDSAEQIACKLLMGIADAEGRCLRTALDNGPVSPEDAAWIRQTFQQCLDIASGLLVSEG